MGLRGMRPSSPSLQGTSAHQFGRASAAIFCLERGVSSGGTATPRAPSMTIVGHRRVGKSFGGLLLAAALLLGCVEGGVRLGAQLGAASARCVASSAFRNEGGAASWSAGRTLPGRAKSGRHCPHLLPEFRPTSSPSLSNVRALGASRVSASSCEMSIWGSRSPRGRPKCGARAVRNLAPKWAFRDPGETWRHGPA